jgi:IS30 family transposase
VQISKVWADADFFLGVQWSPEQIAEKVGVSHACVYLHVYANKAGGGDLPRTFDARNPDANGICADVTGADRSLTAARSASGQVHIEDCKQVGEGLALAGAVSFEAQLDTYGTLSQAETYALADHANR